VTANPPAKIDSKLKTWIEELLPEQDDAADGAQPLNLDELQNSLRKPNDRDATRPGGSRAA